MFTDWTADQLAHIGLKRTKTGVEIDIPEDANIYAMTVGRQIAEGRANAPAMVFEKPDGTLEHWSFGQVDDAATALARTASRPRLRAGRLHWAAHGNAPRNRHCPYGRVQTRWGCGDAFSALRPRRPVPCAQPLRRTLPADVRARLVGTACRCKEPLPRSGPCSRGRLRRVRGEPR